MASHAHALLSSELVGPHGPLQLHLSDAVAAADGAGLVARGVTHVLNVHPDSPMPDAALVSGYRVPVVDDIGAPLHEHLDAAGSFIYGALASGGRCVVYCPSGTSAAPAVVAFYLMRYHSLSLSDALVAVRAARPRAQPNVGFWQRLVEAESWLRPHGTAPLPPSTSIQQYKWSFLERCRPDASREHIVSELEATNREVEALLHRHDFTPVNV